MTAAEILGTANSLLQLANAVNSDILTYRSELTALASEDPCAPDFLDKLNALTQKAALYTQKRDEIVAQGRQLEKDYENLNFFAKRTSEGTAAKDAIAQLKAYMVQINNDARAFGGPARRKALIDANAKCSTEDKKTEKSETPPAEGGATTDAAAAAATPAATEAAPTAVTANPAQNSKQDDQAGGDSTASTNAQATGTAPPVKNESTASSEKPAPKENPLSAFSSYTYAVTLYMVTPEIMNAFVNSGGSLATISDKPGIYIVAQSGGINNATENRLLTFSRNLGKGERGYDYYIDDLNITTLLPGGTNRASVSTEIKFKIIEPQSYNFLTDVQRASAALNQTSDILKQSVLKGVAPNGFSQHYILGIKFYGYDINGNVVTRESPEVSGYDNDSSGAVINRYFAIKFTTIKFRLDGKTVNYNCEALVVSEQAAYGQINATVKNTFNLTGGTVGEILDSESVSSKTPGAKGLAQTINEFVDDTKNRGLINTASKIKIEFLDISGNITTTGNIATSTLIDDETFSSVTAPMSPASTTKQVTIADSFKATSYDKTKKIISVTAGQNVLNIIDNIIVKSSYITDALKETTTQGIEAETKNNPSTKKLEWYTVNPVAIVKTRDDNTNNWVYDVTYQIKPYEIPYIRSNLPGIKSKFQGAYKEYNYLLTGKNTEIISYEQQYDNLYYMVASMSTTPDKATRGNTGSAPMGVQAASKHSDPTTGNQNSGSRLADDIRAQLYSPGDQSEAKIKILGDPDYIMTVTGVKTASTVNRFYNKDSSINPQSGQVFINVIFNTASDYQENGLLDVSDKLQFYRTNRVATVGIKGIVYMVTQVDSSFSRGVFSQTLDCLLVDESQLINDSADRKKAELAMMGDPDGSYTALENRRLPQAASTTVATTTAQSSAATTNSANSPTAPAANLNTDTRTSLKTSTKSSFYGSAPGRQTAPTLTNGGQRVDNAAANRNRVAARNDDTDQPGPGANNPSTPG